MKPEQGTSLDLVINADDAAVRFDYPLCDRKT
jgi:hypothetical protein